MTPSALTIQEQYMIRPTETTALAMRVVELEAENAEYRALLRELAGKPSARTQGYASDETEKGNGNGKACGALTDAQRIDLALKAMEAFTPAIDAALWIALLWNDRNHDSSTILFHAKQAALHLGLKRGGPDPRDELFALWNDALAALRHNARGQGPAACGRSAAPTG